MDEAVSRARVTLYALKNRLNWLPGPAAVKALRAALTVFVVGAVVWLSDPPHLVRTVAGANPALLLAGLLGLCLSAVVGSLKLLGILRSYGIRANLFRLIHLHLSTSLYSLLLPGQIPAEVAKAIRLVRYGGTRTQVTFALMLDKATGLVGLVALGGVCLALSPPRDFAIDLNVRLSIPWLAAGSALVLAGVAGAIGVLRPQAAGFARWLTSHLRDPSSGRIAVPGVRAIVTAVFLGVVFQLGLVLSGWLTALAVGVRVSPIVLGWMHLAIAVAALVPITVAGIGVREGAAIALLSLYGVQTRDAAAISVVLLALELVLAGAGRVLDLVVEEPVPGASLPPSSSPMDSGR
jgi:uncharacterized membrane protein YbhN (UPF0104 family)